MEIPEETQRLDQDQGAAEAQTRKESWAKRRWTWLVLLGLGIAVVTVVFVIIRPGSKNPRGSASSDGRGDSSTGRARADLRPGAEVRLFIPRRDSIMVAADETALNELMNAISARSDGVQSLSESGRIFTVANDTRARIVETHPPKIKVRIIEGDKSMFEGWVPETWVR